MAFIGGFLARYAGSLSGLLCRSCTLWSPAAPFSRTLIILYSKVKDSQILVTPIFPLIAPIDSAFFHSKKYSLIFSFFRSFSLFFIPPSGAYTPDRFHAVSPGDAPGSHCAHANEMQRFGFVCKYHFFCTENFSTNSRLSGRIRCDMVKTEVIRRESCAARRFHPIHKNQQKNDAAIPGGSSACDGQSRFEMGERAVPV